jgi:hypothetical protein
MNNDWVDRLTWRLQKLVQLQGKMIPQASDNKTKAIGLLNKLYFSENVHTYKVASGLLPTMLKQKPSEWLMKIMQ